MNTWGEAFRKALRSGSCAAALSGVALAVCGGLENKAPAGPLNGPSQWVWGKRAALHRRASIRETAVGYAIHHVVSIGWATVHEKSMATLPVRSLSDRLIVCAATSAIACAIDFGLARGRLRPGFERQLGHASLFAVYAAFGLGLALGSPVQRSEDPDKNGTAAF